jgi:hypothetical protein
MRAAALITSEDVRLPVVDEVSYSGSAFDLNEARARKLSMRVLRVFLSSPGDVAEERAVARRLLKDELPYDPFLRGRVAFEVVSWDDPSARTPMLANITPQEGVNKFGPEPAQCDIVIVILWSRLGTHLDVSAFKKQDNSPYLSGTEWEFENACDAQSQAKILVYRRTEKPRVELDDPRLDDRRCQFHAVHQFFDRFLNSDGSVRRGWSEYETPGGFRQRLENDLKHLLREYFSDVLRETAAQKIPRWKGSPYPGLRGFTTDESPIFFGREREVGAILDRLRNPATRFLAVVGASGTGKSSLVSAGVIPRLNSGYIEASQHWQVISFTPGAMGENPFLALTIELNRVFPIYIAKPIQLSAELESTPCYLREYVTNVVRELPAGAALVLYVNQFEELLAVVSDEYRARFIAMLAESIEEPCLRVLVTLRSDFLPQCVGEPRLAELFQRAEAIFPLGHPGIAALPRMIEGPAEAAELELEQGLADQILRDAGADPGVLPLMAFTLEELYQQDHADRRLTLAGYRAIGGLHGAMGRRIDALLGDLRKELRRDPEEVPKYVFPTLVHLDESGGATRRRAFREELLTVSSSMPQLLEKLINGRLLLAEGAGPEATVMLAHEALMQEWPALSQWLDRIAKRCKFFIDFGCSARDPGRSARYRAAK